MVDGLDEADPPSSGSNPLLLPATLPKGVYIAVTRRTGRMRTTPGTRVQQYTVRRDDPLQSADIEEFVRARVAGDTRIADVLASSDPPVSPDDLVARLVGASEGNFMYVSYVLADLAERGPQAPPLDLTSLPPGLEGYYDQFWDRISSSQAQNWAEWESLYQPVAERLAAAREAVTADWLAAQTGRLDDLASVYQRPIEEFLRHNEDHGWTPSERLPNGARVNVPDPGFAPLIAARLSAAVLAGGPPSPELSALLRHLVPVTGADVTALWTVMARLLLCSPTPDSLLLTELRPLVTEVASATAE